MYWIRGDFHLLGSDLTLLLLMVFVLCLPMCEKYIPRLLADSKAQSGQEELMEQSLNGDHLLDKHWPHALFRIWNSS